MRLVRVCAVIGLLFLPSAAPAQTGAAPRRSETYEAVTIDANGSLVVTTSDQRTIVVRKKRGQTSFADPMISGARTAVGAQAEYKNCCTSYDIPLQLVVYANRKEHRFSGIGLPVFQWHFTDDGTRVAFGQAPVHFGCSIHYELRDVESERLIDSADVPEPCGQEPNPPAVKIPKWVADLNAGNR